MNKRTSHKVRAGWTTIEALTALVAISVAQVLLLQVSKSSQQQRRIAAQHQRAQLEAANILEQLSTRHWRELDSDRLAQTQLPPDALEMLPNAKLKIEVQTTNQPVLNKTIKVTISWTIGSRSATVQLVGWRYGREVLL